MSRHYNRVLLNAVLWVCVTLFTFALSHANADVGPLVYNLVAVHTSKCIDLPWGNTTITNLQFQQYDCNGADSLKLQLHGTEYNGTPYLRISYALAPTHYLTENGTSDASPVVRSQAAGVASLWSLQVGTDGKFSFVNAESGKCLDIGGWINGSPVQVFTCSGLGNQQFYLEPVSGHWKIKAVHSSKCLDIENDSSADGARVEQDTCNGGWSQQWKVIPRKSSGTFIFYNRGTGRVVDLTGGVLTNGTAIQQYSYQNNDNQTFYLNAYGIARLGNGQQPYQIAKAVGAWNCIDIEGESQLAGANAQIWECLGANKTNQLFTFEQ